MKHRSIIFSATATLFAAIPYALTGTTLAAEPEPPPLRIRPVEYVTSAPLPDDLPQEFFLGGGGDTGVTKIKYLVEGAAIVGIDKLDIASIKLADGTEISKLREEEKTTKNSIVGTFFFGEKTKDEPAWQLGTFPRVSHDGDYATFELEIHRPLLGKIESTKIAGTATILLGYDRKDQTIELTANEKRTVEVGPFKITVVPVKPEAEPKPKADLQVMPFPGMPTGPTCDLSISGPLNSLGFFEMLDGTERLRALYNIENDKRTYHPAVPKTGKYTLKLGFWNTVKKVAVPLGDKL